MKIEPAKAMLCTLKLAGLPLLLSACTPHQGNLWAVCQMTEGVWECDSWQDPLQRTNMLLSVVK